MIIINEKMPRTCSMCFACGYDPESMDTWCNLQHPVKNNIHWFQTGLDLDCEESDKNATCKPEWCPLKEVQ